MEFSLAGGKTQEMVYNSLKWSCHFKVLFLGDN